MPLPATPEARTAAWYHLKEFLRERESEHRRLLSMWVSELEPEFVYSRDAMQLIGITVKGWRDVILYARGWPRSAQDFWVEMAFIPTRRPVPRDFCWSGVDLGVETSDRSVTMMIDPDLKISYYIETKDIDPEVFGEMQVALWPKVQK